VRAAQQSAGYPVTLDGRPVIMVHWGVTALPPERRALLISERLHNVADSLREPGGVKISQLDEQMFEVAAANTSIATVFPGDARAAGVQADVLASQWATAFDRAIEQYRAERRWSKRIQRLLLMLATVVGAAIALVLVRKLTTGLAAMAVSRFESRISIDERKVVAVLARKRMLPVIHSLFKGLRAVLSLLVIGFALHFLLFFFPRTAAAAASILGSLLGMLKSFGSAVLIHVPALMFLLLVVLATWYALKLSDFIFRGLGDGTLTIEGFRPVWAPTTQRIVSILLIVLALLIAYPYIPGSDSAAFKGVSIFIGLLVSLGSTGLMANIVTGIMLTYMDAFHKGDFIQIEDRFARVERMSMLTTQLRTRWNEVLTIPNSLILSKEVTNLSLADERGLAIRSTVGIGYDVPWRQIEGMLKLAASRTEGVSHTLEPYVFTLSLNQFDITYELNAYLEPGAPYFETRSRLNRNVLDAFNEFGVQIMTPAYEGDPERVKVVPKSHWFATPAVQPTQNSSTSDSNRVREHRKAG
jgi:small-conductance mechanosensitive channel